MISKPQIVLLTFLAVVVLVFAVDGIVGDDSDAGDEGSDVIVDVDQDGSADIPDGEGTDGAGDYGYTAPGVNDRSMGHLRVVDATTGGIPLVTYIAVPEPGYQFDRWEDLEGNFLSSSAGLTFPVFSDKRAVAVFSEASVRTIELSWHMPVFGADGMTFDPEESTITIAISTLDYQASIADPDIQRSGTLRSPSPAALLSDDGAVLAVADQLRPYMEGMSTFQKSFVILSFVQDAIGYSLDRDQYGQEEFWATPMETLYSGYGDCEDTALLFVSLASMFGIETGFVTFESDVQGNPGTGHMSVAVALTEGASITGTDTATFTVDGVEYAYGETAADFAPGDELDKRPLFGMLGVSYDIGMGKWTAVHYDPETGFTADSYLSIGIDRRSSGTVVYGAGFEDPPALDMTVGNSISYQPVLNLPSEVSASGEGLHSEGGFLFWDPVTDTLYGTASEPGVYSVELTAVWTSPEGGLTQTAYQNVVINVLPSGGEADGDYVWIYGDGAWGAEPTGSDDGDVDGPTDGAEEGSDTSDGGDLTLLVVALVGIVIVASVLIGRRFV